MDKLAPLINELVKIVQASVDVVSGQLPDVAKQIVRYYLWGNIIEIPLMLTVMGIGIYWGKCAIKKAMANEWADAPWMIALVPIFIVELIIGFNAWGYFDTMLRAALEPKVLIIETLRMYIK
jgi:hypothetical protein